jgi:NTP pyrophosphatase (non-canonical NTP hydrolase)
MALAGEAGELLEHFQWLTEQQSSELDTDSLRKVADEIADIQIYLARLADKLGISVAEAVERKLDTNERRYPATLVRGSAQKYTDYGNDE